VPVLRQLEKQGTRSGLQKYECKRSPRPNQNLEDKTRQKARMLQVSQFAAGETSMSPREPPMPATSEVTELDEL
jgi:hypothetical protein